MKKAISTVEYLIIVGAIILIAAVLLYVIKTMNVESNQYLVNKTVENIENISFSIFVGGIKDEQDPSNLCNVYNIVGF